MDGLLRPQLFPSDAEWSRGFSFIDRITEFGTQPLHLTARTVTFERCTKAYGLVAPGNDNEIFLAFVTKLTSRDTFPVIKGISETIEKDCSPNQYSRRLMQRLGNAEFLATHFRSMLTSGGICVKTMGAKISAIKCMMSTIVPESQAETLYASVKNIILTIHRCGS